MFTSAHGKGSQLFSLWVAMAIAVSGSVADDVLGLIDSEESGAWRFDLIPFYYEAVGEGYCVGSEGDALNKIIQFTIPDEFKESRYEMKRFCGKWCHYEAQYSGFQIHNNTLTQELDCQCLIGNGEKVANAINDGSGEYLQCFSFISPSVIDDFQFKGYGGCMDADFQNYDRVEHVKVTSLEDCRTICLESSGSTKLAGLEYDNPTMNCYCQFADKQGPVGPVDHDYVNTACYAFSQFIPKPAISTTTPSLSHSVTTSAAVVTTISSTSMTWEDVLPSYKALGEGYCVNSAGQPSFIYSQTLIPESSSISNEYASHFCGNYCDDTQSNHSGFQIRRDHIHQNLQCHCLKNEGQESDSIDDASGEYLQCFQHIMSQTAVDRNPSTANNVDMTTTLIAILFMHYYIF